MVAGTKACHYVFCQSLAQTRTCLVNQLATLERRTSRGGRDVTDHSPGARDDVANVRAGVPNITVNLHYGHGDGAADLTELAIFSIAHGFIGLRHVGVSVDRVSYKDTSTKQG